MSKEDIRAQLNDITKNWVFAPSEKVYVHPTQEGNSSKSTQKTGRKLWLVSCMWKKILAR